MIKRLLLALLGFALIVAILGGFKALQIGKLKSMSHAMPPTSVTTVEAVEATWSPLLGAIATLSPVQGVTLATDADGVVSRIAVESGGNVRAGDLLVELDTTVETAQLAAAEARLKIAELNRSRAAELLQKNTISQAELDQADAELNQSRADVDALRAQLAKKQVRAPFAGRVGIRSVNVGQFVARGSALMPLQQLDPIYVDFTIPQRNLPELAVGQSVEIRVDAFPGRTFSGAINAINPQVDPLSRNVAVQATVENPEELLRAGMFAHVDVQLPPDGSTVILPATAIAYASYGNSVFIIETMKGPDGQEYLGARQQFVKLGATRGDQIAVLEGVKPGQTVASAGVFKLRNGAPVQINNEKLPANAPDPRPENT